MRHEERMHLAQDLCARMVATHPGDVILGGVYGSTARGTDTRWSDLEMLFVVHDGSQAAGKNFIYRGIAIGYQVIERPKLERLLTNPPLEWPVWSCRPVWRSRDYRSATESATADSTRWSPSGTRRAGVCKCRLLGAIRHGS